MLSAYIGKPGYKKGTQQLIDANSPNATPKVGSAEVPTISISKSRKKVNRKYLKAVKAGDMETAQQMVDEAAEKAGYTIHAYHGTKNGGFTVFDYSKIGASSKVSLLGDGFYFSDSGDVAAKYVTQGTVLCVARNSSVFYGNDENFCVLR